MTRTNTHGWQDGDIVSQQCGDVAVTGKVVELKRHSDGAAFLMVQIIGGGKIGLRTWPDGFILGYGKLQKRCDECSRDFRTNDSDETFCRACARHQRGLDPLNTTRSIAGTLRGAPMYPRKGRA